jgi:hypothetical protein
LLSHGSANSWRDTVTKKTTRRKLDLRRETVRDLSSDALRGAAGATQALGCIGGTTTLSQRHLGCTQRNSFTCVSCVTCLIGCGMGGGEPIG